jgi:uncharacterized protein YdiU (UPF0061 family)
MSSLADIPKSHTFTDHLPPDPAIPTPDAATEKAALTHSPRVVRDALYTFVKPEPADRYELLATSPACFNTLRLDPGEAGSEIFGKLVSGNDVPFYKDHHPWAQCYGGYQFGQWASQLGDGRAISLFEVTPAHGERYELQLKGAGMTPYSRFADGKAVLRSSIREFLISEHLHALGIPTTRALSLTLLPDRHALRERVEPCAIVLRAAQTWIRFGTFDLLRRRGDRVLTKKLTDYCIEHVFGESKLVPVSETYEGKGNIYERLYREIVNRTALLVGKMQAYAFQNGVLNTDNTSIFGLSMDYGPFAFMDTFDPDYTPNHDDGQLRYSYRMQPTAFWWNCTRLGEALGELMGAGDKADELFSNQTFLDNKLPDDELDPILTRAEAIIGDVAQAYKKTFLSEYRRLMTERFGLDLENERHLEFLSETLDMMQAYELDFQHFFYRLGQKDVSAKSILGGVNGQFGGHGKDKAIETLTTWLKQYNDAVQAQASQPGWSEEERLKRMRAANPQFVLRSWILDEVIRRVEKDGERDILKQVLDYASRPFDSFEGEEEALRFCGDIKKSGQRDMQCSCSS